MSPLKVKVRYQQKALDEGNKMNVGIELNIHSYDSYSKSSLGAYGWKSTPAGHQ